MLDDHSKLIRLETEKEAFEHTLEEMRLGAQRREQKLDDLRRDVDRSLVFKETTCKGCIQRLENLELRVRALENTKFYWVGAIAAVSFISSLLAKFI